MGRMYYSNVGAVEERLIHVFHTDEGTIVLAMRPPKVGERGYAVGVDFTVVNAVREMLSDWDPSEDGPGWIQGPVVQKVKNGDEQTYDVTILAAYELDPLARDLIAMARENAIDDSGTCKTDHQAEDCDECGTKAEVQ